MTTNTSALLHQGLARKLHTFAEDPIEAARAFAKREARKYLMTNGAAKLKKSGAFECVANFVATRPAEALSPDYADLWFLYATARARKPHIIVEFGSGCSTAVLSQALLHNRREGTEGRIYSVDADPYWAAAATGGLSEEMRDVCEISYSPLVEIDYNGTPAFRHALVPDVSPDMVYLDGPALTPERQVAVDVLDLEERLQLKACIVVDGRVQNTQFLTRHLKRRFRFQKNHVLFNHVFWLDS